MEQDGQHETFAFEEDGEFIVLNDKYYLRYYEHQNGQATPVQFRLDDGEVHIHRQGATETWLVFDPEQPTITRYRTEYGVMQLQVVTSRLDRVLDPDTPRAGCSYATIFRAAVRRLEVTKLNCILRPSIVRCNLDFLKGCAPIWI
ncbi:MAG: DUF1934 domain-containing protein [Limosilactobacillus pontis]